MGRINRISLPSYQTFGMRQAWLMDFFRLKGKWISSNDLGNRQMDSMVIWLRHAELTAGSKRAFEIKPLARTISRLGDNTLMQWAIIWTNLARNSTLVQWYVNNIPWGSSASKKDYIILLGEEFNLSYRSRTNAISALFQLLNKTPLGKQLGLGIDQTTSRRNTTLYKKGWRNPDQISILYSLYRYAEKVDRYGLTVSELYEGVGEGPYVLFGVDKECLKGILRGLAAQYRDFIKVEIVRDLDNIFLNNAYKPNEVLELV